MTGWRGSVTLQSMPDAQTFKNDKHGCPANNHHPDLCFVCKMQFDRDAAERKKAKADTVSTHRRTNG